MLVTRLTRTGKHYSHIYAENAVHVAAAVCRGRPFSNKDDAALLRNQAFEATALDVERSVLALRLTGSPSLL
jgi:hypothetical protein